MGFGLMTFTFQKLITKTFNFSNKLNSHINKARKIEWTLIIYYLSSSSLTENNNISNNHLTYKILYQTYIYRTLSVKRNDLQFTSIRISIMLSIHMALMVGPYFFIK